jgi:hypothetical protein
MSANSPLAEAPPFWRAQPFLLKAVKVTLP